MNKVKTLDDLKKMRESLRASLDLREKSNTPDQLVQIKVSMATCGIAAGAKEIMSYFIEVLDRQRIDALVTQTGCMGYCYGNRLSKSSFRVRSRWYSVMLIRQK